MRKIMSTLLAIAILLSVFALPGSATLVGSSVNGSLTFDGDPSNYFDPGYGFVPATGYLNGSGTTVVISSNAVEFGFDDGSGRISADFTNNRLTISELIETPEANNSFQMIFTDSAFSLQSLLPVSDNFPISYRSLVGDVITVGYAGGTATVGQTLTATFDVTPSPEPSTLGAVLISCLIALAVFLARLKGAR